MFAGSPAPSSIVGNVVNPSADVANSGLSVWKVA
jgi:hypothetical protein